MSEPLNVDPVDLHVTGAALASAAQDAHSAFAQNRLRLEEAVTGLFTSSRAAMLDKSDQWHVEATRLAGQVDDHGSQLHTSAALYTETEQTSTTALHKLSLDDPNRPR